jgi:hypothetical protein
MSSDVFLEGLANGNDEAAALYYHYSAQEEQEAAEYAAARARQIRAAKERVIANMTVQELELLDKKLVATKKQEADAAPSKVVTGFFLFLGLLSLVPGTGMSWTAHIVWVVIGLMSAVMLFSDSDTKQTKYRK